MTDRFLGLLAALSALAFQPGLALAGDGAVAALGWQPEQGVAAPSYALATPTTSNLNIDSIVLSCEQEPGARGVQLRLYLSGDGPLAPVGADLATLRVDPEVMLTVDGVDHDAELLFADDSVLVANGADGRLPVLSDELLSALEKGRQLELKFDLIDSPEGQLAFSGRATLDLQAGAGGATVAALRACAGAAKVPLATASRTR